MPVPVVSESHRQEQNPHARGFPASVDCNTEMALEVAEHMHDDRNPGHSKLGRAGKRAKVEEPPSDPETKPCQEAVERHGKRWHSIERA